MFASSIDNTGDEPIGSQLTWSKSASLAPSCVNLGLKATLATATAATLLYAGPSYITNTLHDFGSYAADNFCPPSIAKHLTALASSSHVPSLGTARMAARCGLGGVLVGSMIGCVIGATGVIAARARSGSLDNDVAPDIHADQSKNKTRSVTSMLIDAIRKIDVQAA